MPYFIIKHSCQMPRENCTQFHLLTCGSIPNQLAAWLCEESLLRYLAGALTSSMVKGLGFFLFAIIMLKYKAKALDEGRQVDVVSLDFAKAVNRVAHEVLLQKLCNFGISGVLLNWCHDYLTNREQRVVIDRVNSSWCSILPGVPEGSLLGPLFFVIFISDLPEVVTPGNTASLYADDCKTSRVINCPANHSLFQTDIDNIYRWSLQNCMEFNVKKCKLMRICKKKVCLSL